MTDRPRAGPVGVRVPETGTRAAADGPRYSAGGVSTPVPPGWAPVPDAPDALLALTVEHRPGVFTPNVVVTEHEIDPGESLAHWADRATEMLTAQIPSLHVLDAGPAELADRPAHRVLSHYPLPGFGGVTVEQWLTVEGGRGIVLAATVGTLEYDAIADDLAALAGALRIGGAG